MMLLDWLRLFVILEVELFLLRGIVLFLGVICCCRKALSSVNLGLQRVSLSSLTFSAFSLSFEELSMTISA